MGKERPTQPDGHWPAICRWRHFAPVLGLWGAALGGLTLAVLPARFFGENMQAAAAILAAVAGAVLMGALGAAAHRRALLAWDRTPDVSAPRELVAEIEAESPRSCTLAEFAELPGRNAVWVEEPPQTPAGALPEAPLPAETTAPQPKTEGRAMAKLRSEQPARLGLIQLVERLAAALEEPGRRAMTEPDAPNPSFAPPQAPRPGPPAEMERTMRDALARLGSLDTAA